MKAFLLQGNENSVDYPPLYPDPQPPPATEMSMVWCGGGAEQCPGRPVAFALAETSAQVSLLASLLPRVQPGPQRREHQALAQSQQRYKASCQPAETGYNGSNEQ